MSRHLDAAIDVMDEAVRKAAIERLSIAITNVRHFVGDLDFVDQSPAQRARLIRDLGFEVAVAANTLNAIRLAEGLEVQA